MKAIVLPNWGIELVAEDDSERYLLDRLDAQGIRVIGMSPARKSITICSPELANLKQIHLTRKQQIMLMNGLAVELKIFRALVSPTRALSPPLPKEEES